MFLTRDNPRFNIEIGHMAGMLLVPLLVFLLDIVFFIILLMKNLK